MDFIKRLLNLPGAPKAGSPPNYGSSEADQIIRWRAALDAYGFPFRIVPHAGVMEAFAADTWEFDQDMLEAAAAELRVNNSWFLWWD